MAIKSIVETICDSCSHHDVCSIKQNYLEIVSDLKTVYYNSKGISGIEKHFSFRDPECLEYQRTLQIPPNTLIDNSFNRTF